MAFLPNNVSISRHAEPPRSSVALLHSTSLFKTILSLVALIGTPLIRFVIKRPDLSGWPRLSSGKPRVNPNLQVCTDSSSCRASVPPCSSKFASCMARFVGWMGPNPAGWFVGAVDWKRSQREKRAQDPWNPFATVRVWRCICYSLFFQSPMRRCPM